jgi:alpha-tubulin suppressor-like RCC1 family protein
MVRPAVLFALLLTVYRVGCDSCGGSPADSDAGPSDAGPSDAGPSDAGGVGDAGLPGVRIVQIAAGASSVCAVLSSGEIKCWGNNDAGQLGHGSGPSSGSPVTVTGIETGVAVAVAYGHACALLDGGAVECWGNNATGQLGDGTTHSSPVPVLASGVADAVSITVGGQSAVTPGGWEGHSCALLGGGGVMCWGEGDWVGGSSTNVPVAVALPGPAIAVAASGADTCVLFADGGVVCCCDDNQLEMTGAMNLDGGAVALVSSPNGDDLMVQLASGQLAGWGPDKDGQLGNGATEASYSPTPYVVLGIDTATAMAVEGVTWDNVAGHGCAVLRGGTVQCWGADNTYGELGNRTTNPALTPSTVTGIANALAVTVGSGANSLSVSQGFSCALLGDNTVQCWGYGGDGELGTSVTTFSTTPVTVGGVP